jgi:hypothetical protein
MHKNEFERIICMHLCELTWIYTQYELICMGVNNKKLNLFEFMWICVNWYELVRIYMNRNTWGNFIWIYVIFFELLWIYVNLYAVIVWIVRLSGRAAVCGSAAVCSSARVVVCGSVHVGVRQCACSCMAVVRAAVCDCPAVRQCAAVRQYATVQQCAAVWAAVCSSALSAGISSVWQYIYTQSCSQYIYWYALTGAVGIVPIFLAYYDTNYNWSIQCINTS